MVPNIISTKDLSYLEDIFEWNFNACKQVNSIKKDIKEIDILNMLDQVCNTHKNICTEITNILGGNYE